jgi:hypothetical protein
MKTRPLLESFQASKWAQPNARVSNYYIVEVKMSNKCEITQFTHTRVMHSVESLSFGWIPKMYSDWSLCSLLRFNEQANSQAREGWNQREAPKKSIYYGQTLMERRSLPLTFRHALNSNQLTLCTRTSKKWNDKKNHITLRRLLSFE